MGWELSGVMFGWIMVPRPTPRPLVTPNPRPWPRAPNNPDNRINEKLDLSEIEVRGYLVTGCQRMVPWERWCGPGGGQHWAPEATDLDQGHPGDLHWETFCLTGVWQCHVSLL